MIKRNLFLIICLAITVSACAPGHQMVFEQLKSNQSGQVLSVQGYVIKSMDETVELHQKWVRLAKLMKQKPGFISCYLSPGIGQSPLWLAHSKWESLDALKNAFSDPLVLKLEEEMPSKFDHLFSLGDKGEFHKEITKSPILDDFENDIEMSFEREFGGCEN